MLRVLFALSVLALSGGHAYAAACVAPAGLPSGDSFEILNSTPLIGTLDGFSGSSYPMCDSSGTTLLTSSPVINAVIPFTPPLLQFLQITVASQSSPLGKTFDLLVDGTSYLNTSSLVLSVSSALHTLGITEHFSTAADGDELSVSISRYNFIPEPASIGLVGLGALCLGALRRRRGGKAV